MSTSALSKIAAKISAKLQTIKWKAGNKLLARYRRRNLKRLDFSVISNNCVAGGIYQKLGLPYATPTVGLFFFCDDYLDFLENFEYIIKQPLRFRKDSRHPEANDYITTAKHYYPIGVLGDKVEVHFLHYKNEQEAREKWSRRVGRINFQNLFFICGDKESFQEACFIRYEKLKFKNRLFISSTDREPSNLVVSIKADKSDPISLARVNFSKNFDLVGWLNGESAFKKNNAARVTGKN